MARIAPPPDLNDILNKSYEAIREIPGFLTEAEARFLGMAAACVPASGTIVEIGSFKGKSAVMLGRISKHYGLPPMVSIDPHNFANPQFHEFRRDPNATTYDAFCANLRGADVADFVESHRKYSSEMTGNWNRPIRLLWIDGDHSWAGAKADFDGFFGHLEPGGIVAFHDALHEFDGPIRVFVEQILSSDQFGAAGFVGSIAWAQYRPLDGARFRNSREQLARIASRIIPYVASGEPLRGIRKLLYKYNRSRVPRTLPTLETFAGSLSS